PPPPFPGAVLEHAAEGALPRVRLLATGLPLGGSEPVRTESAPAEGAEDPRPAALLLGYGQHARTVVLPAVRRYLRVARIHEIDPVPSGGARLPVAWSTTPHLGREPDPSRYRAAFIATYHHTHAPLAAEALARGLYAVVEQPLATDHRQLDRRLERLDRSGPRLYAAFQRRYHPFNDLALRDLGAAPGDPISYHCIVYEHPLPSRHWYAWPNTRSRILSNGCHWIDHFLHLNGYADPVRAQVHCSSAGVANCSVELRNGAYFTMVLADNGSGRRGVRDYVELRAGTRT